MLCVLKYQAEFQKVVLFVVDAPARLRTLSSASCAGSTKSSFLSNGASTFKPSMQ